MRIHELLSAIQPKTPVRVHVNGHSEIAGVTGPRNTLALQNALLEAGCSDAYVTAIRPLWHANELYIECYKW